MSAYRVSQGTRALLSTLIAGSLLTGLLGLFGVFHYVGDVASAIGALVFLAAAVTNGIAALALWGKQKWWPGVVALGLLMTSLLASYMTIAEFRSPERSIMLLIVALLVLAANVGWLFFLLPKLPALPGKYWAAAAAVFPLLGLFQLWLETDYLPRRERPLVDSVVEITELSRVGSLVNLRAELTLHNRGPIEATHIGSLWRITAYPLKPDEATGKTSLVAEALDWLPRNVREFRDVPVAPESGRLLYADEILPLTAFLLPGETWSRQAIVSVDTSAFGRVRVAAEIAFLTEGNIRSIRTCYPVPSLQGDSEGESEGSRVVSYTDEDFGRSARKPLETMTGGHVLCVETELAHRNVVQALVDDNPVIRTFVVLDDPTQQEIAYPYLLTALGTSASLSSSSSEEQIRRLDVQNPSAVIDVEAEYVVGDSPPAADAPGP